MGEYRPCGIAHAAQRAEIYQLLKEPGADIEPVPHRPLAPSSWWHRWS